MSKLLKKILWFPKSGITQNITDSINLDSSRGLEIRNNSVVLEVKNAPQYLDSNYNRIHKYVNPDFSLKFNDEDQIKVWVKYTDDFAVIEDSFWNNDTDDDGTYASDLIGVYYLIEMNTKRTSAINTLTLKCVDKTYILFNRLLAKAFKGQELSGTTTATTSGKLVDSSANFDKYANVGMVVKNTTDATETYITAIDSATTLSLNDNIFTSGETYTIHWNAPSVVQKIVRYSTQSPNGQFTGTGADSGVKYEVDAKFEDIESGYIELERSDGSPFPAIAVSKIWKPVYEWLSEISQVDYINSTDEVDNENYVYKRPHLFYIDQNNRFHWTATTDVIDTTYTVGTTEGLYEHDIGKNVFDTVNFIVFRGGDDLYGVGITNYQLSKKTTVKRLKMRVVAMTDISKKLMDAEKAAGNLVDNASGTFTDGRNRYNRNGTVIPKWVTDGTSYSSDSTYNAAFTEEVERLCRIRSDALIGNLGQARYGGRIARKGVNINSGALIEFTDTGVGIYKAKLRTDDIRHNITKDGWFTDIQCEEDVGELK